MSNFNTVVHYKHWDNPVYLQIHLDILEGPLVLMIDSDSEHVAHALRKIGPKK